MLKCTALVVAVAWTSIGLAGYSLRTLPLPGEFSRGISVAETSQREWPALLAGTELSLLAWSRKDEDGIHPALIQVNPTGDLSTPKELALPKVEYLGHPQLLLIDDRPWLFFIGRALGMEDRSLYGMPLTEEGGIAGPPRRFVGSELWEYEIVLGGTGVWMGYKDAGGLVWLASFTLEQGTEFIWKLGQGEGPPALVPTEQGIHVIWAKTEGSGPCVLMYTWAENKGLNPPMELHSFPLPTGTVVSQPAGTAASGWVYAAVGFEYRGGEQPGRAEVWVISFPVGHPDECIAYSLGIPETFPGEYPLQMEGLDMARLPPRGHTRPTDLYNPRGVLETTEYALLTLGARLHRGRSHQVQPVVVAFAGGRPVAWRPVAVSRDMTYAVQLGRSSRGWHVTWLDMLGYGAYRLFYASTAELERQAFNRIGWDDAIYFLGTVASGWLGGLALTPLFIMASVPGLVLIFIHYLLGGEESLAYRWPRALLALGLLPYVILKIVLTGTFGGMPFAEWVSRFTAQVVGRVLPFVPSLLGIVGVWIYTRRAGEPTLFPAWAAFVVTDMAFTIMILGPVFAGG
ncbi:hypothetical protein H5T52_08740 [Candidatus Bipolaricaulota bacterium]|nr:hypothetical protein [Candidatus Bipolaricaulota bacterium]